MFRKSAVVCILLLVATLAIAGPSKGTPLNATMQPNLSADGTGVSDDGNPSYNNGVAKVQSYLGAGGQNLDLITYATGRKMTFSFPSGSAAWQISGLPEAVAAEVDMFGVNFYGPFQTMGVGTTAQMNTSIQFKYATRTYELDYASLAVKRIDATTWLVTSDHATDIIWDPGFTASSAADLSVFRRKSRDNFGQVNMPIRMIVTLQ